MSGARQSPIRFQLNESIWLDHHARSAEITSLSLEPEVEVYEDSGLVSIKGHLILTGRFDTSEEEEEALDLESSSLADQLNFQPLRVDQKEIYQKEYKGKIERRFPVDVTVPQEKIDDLEQVYVHVEQFDYAIEDQHRLEIEADVAIFGINTESEKDFMIEKRNGELRADPVYPSFDVAATKDEIPESEQEPEEPPVLYTQQDGEKGRDPEQDKAEAKKATESEEEKIYKNQSDTEEKGKERPHNHKLETNKASPSEETPVLEKQDNLVLGTKGIGDADEEDQKEEERELISRTFLSEDKQHAENEAVHNPYQGQEHSLDENELDGEKQPNHEKVIPLFDERIRTNFNASPAAEEDEQAIQEEVMTDKTTSFLSQLMSNRDDEENQDYTKLKMCIIQKDESLQDIAQRYELPVTDIMRVNRMETQEIQEGQILYIPTI